MYIDRAERAWKNDTNLPAQEKLKCILKILNSFATPPEWLGADSKCPETILGLYTRGVMYIGRARGKWKNDTNPLLTRKS